MTTKDERKLLSEDPLLVLPSLAKTLGLNEAIILQQIHYWLTINEGKESNFRDGYYWTFNSISEWQKQFPFWGEKTIQRALRKVERKGIVVAGCYNKRSFDRTKWYRLDYAKLREACPLDQNSQIQWTKKVRPLPQNDLMGEATHYTKMTSPIPETNITKNTTEIKGTIKKKETGATDLCSCRDTGNTSFGEDAPLMASAQGNGLIRSDEVTSPSKRAAIADAIEVFLRTNGTTTLTTIASALDIRWQLVNRELLTDKRFKKAGRDNFLLAEKDNKPLMAEGSPALKGKDDSPESHPGASVKVKVQPFKQNIMATYEARLAKLSAEERAALNAED